MIQFLIKVDNVKYQLPFASSVDAVIDALDRFPNATKIFVKAITL